MNKPLLNLNQYPTSISKPNTESLASLNLNIGKVIYIGIIFMIQFSAWKGLQNLLALVLQQIGFGSLGLFALLVFNFFFGGFSFISPKYATMLSYKNTFALSCAPMLIFMIFCVNITDCKDEELASTLLCSEFVLTALMLIISAILGIACSVLWVTQSVYVNECSNKANKGKMFGIFWSLTQFSQISGNILVNYFYKVSGAKGLFTATSLLVFFALIMFLFIKDPDYLTSNQTDQDTIEMTPSNHSRNFNNLDFTNNEKKDNNKTDSDFNMDKMMIFCRRVQFRNMIPLIIMAGISCVIYVTYLASLSSKSVSYLSAEDNKAYVGYILFVLGVSEVVTGPVFGYILDRGHIFGLQLLYVIHIIASLLIFIGYVFNSYWIFFLVAIIFGACDCGSQTLISVLLGAKFTEKFEPFAGYRGVYCSFLGVCFTLGMIIGDNILIMLFVYICIIYYGYIRINQIVL